MSQSARRLTLLNGVLIMAGWLLGCTRSAALPPPVSISPPPPAPPPAASFLPETSTPLLEVPQVTSWKPAVPARAWKYIVIHHTASTTGSVESIHETHLKRRDASGKPWKGIGYHFVIGNGRGMPDGEIEPTFRWNQQMHGAHAGSGTYNQEGIGIVLVGNFEESPPSTAQLVAVKRLVQSLRSGYRITSKNVIGHKDVKATACPGKLFPMAEIAGYDDTYLLGRENDTRTPSGL